MKEYTSSELEGNSALARLNVYVVVEMAICVLVEMVIYAFWGEMEFAGALAAVMGFSSSFSPLGSATSFQAASLVKSPYASFALQGKETYSVTMSDGAFFELPRSLHLNVLVLHLQMRRKIQTRKWSAGSVCDTGDVVARIPLLQPCRLYHLNLMVLIFLVLEEKQIRASHYLSVLVLA